MLQQLNKNIISYNSYTNYEKNSYCKQYFKKKDLNVNEKNIYNEVFKIKTVYKKKDYQTILYINLNKENSRFSLLSSSGQILFNCSQGSVGFTKAQRKKTHGIKVLFQFFLSKISKFKFNNFILCIQGFSRGRRIALKLVGGSPLRKKCLSIIDVTKSPYNGTRARKRPRI